MAQDNSQDDYTFFDEEEMRRRTGGGITGGNTPSVSDVTTAPTGGAFDESRVPQGVPMDWARDFESRNDDDYHRMSSAYASDQQPKNQPMTVAQEWNAAPMPSDWANSWFSDFRARTEADAASSKQRGDMLFNTLMERVNQSKTPDAGDPIIRNQVDAFRAEKERARRTYLADAAEGMGPTANLRGEARLAGERMGSEVGGFQADLMSREVEARRAEIQNALSAAVQTNNGDKVAALQQEMAILDQMAKEQGLELSKYSLDQDWRGRLLSNDMSMRQLGLQEWDRSMYYDLLQRGLLG